VLIGRSETTCAVCTDKIYNSAITTIEGCMHSLHFECLLPYLQLKINEGVVDITCPFQGCPTLIDEHFLRRTLNEEDMRKYYRFSAYSFVERMKHTSEIKWLSCQEPNCNELFVIVREPHRVKTAQTNLL
jgi:hypothetical protein